MNGDPNLLSRRRVLEGLGAIAVSIPLIGRGAKAASMPIELAAKPGRADLLGRGYGKTEILGFNGQVPGPIIRLKQGGEVAVRYRNELTQASSVHWHGVRIHNAMDGVPGLTQEPVPPRGTFDYRFKVPDAGTYWYHPHKQSSEQIGRGLYGLLIVDEHNPPRVDRDIALVLDDWRLKPDGQIHAASFGSVGERAHGGRIGNVLTVNGKPRETLRVKANERLRLRLCCTTNARILQLAFDGFDAHLVAVDGQPVPPRRLAGDLIGLAPGQRIDVIADMVGRPGSVATISEVSELRLPVVRMDYDQKDKARAEPLGSVDALPANPLSPVKEKPDQTVDLHMSGGAMGRMRSASFKGKALDLRTLAREHGLIWAFNGVAGMPDKPLFTAERGQTVAVRMINETRWPHAMHLHGHHVQITQRSGRGPKQRYWRDTVLVQPLEEVTMSLVADNPGKWMIHCHMLEHQAGGMLTWFEVAT